MERERKSQKKSKREERMMKEIERKKTTGEKKEIGRASCRERV